MKLFFDYIKEFEFKNLFAILLTGGLIYLLATRNEIRSDCLILLTLIVKHFYDSNTSAVKRDATISKALESAQNTASQATVTNADSVVITPENK